MGSGEDTWPGVHNSSAMQTGLGEWDASWLWSLPLIAVTIAIHATGIVFLAKAIGRYWRDYVVRRHSEESIVVAISVVVVAALCLAILHGIESFVWAFAYLRLGALQSAAAATLYSVDSITTRGASGVFLAQHWRMMGAVEAADGMLLFGLSTAFLFAVMQRLFFATRARLMQ